MSTDPRPEWERDLLQQEAERRAAAERLPRWVIELVHGLIRYEDEHPKLYAKYAAHGLRYVPADCPEPLLDLVPHEVVQLARRVGGQPETDAAPHGSRPRG